MSDAANTLVFDGDCGFCTTSAGWITRHWPADADAVAVAWQHLPPDFFVRAHLSVADLERAAWWVTPTTTDEGARAVARALMAAGGFWRFLGRLLLVPPVSWLAPYGYRLVSRYRYKLPGGTPACRIGS